MKRIASTLFVFLIAASLAADSYHPDLTKSQVVSLDVRTIESNANSGKPIDLNLGEVKLTITLSPAPVEPEEGVTYVVITADGSIKTSVVKSSTSTYGGDVAGEDPDESEARFTIANGVLDGWVFSTTGWWFVEPLRRFDPKAGFDQYLVYATHDVDAVTIDFGDDWKTDQVTQTPNEQHRLVIPIVMAADKEYVEADPTTAFDVRQRTLINSVNGIFGPQVGRRFQIVRFALDDRNRVLTSSDAFELRNQLKCLINIVGTAPCPPGHELEGLNNMGAYMAHLTTAKNLVNGTDWQYGLPDMNGRFGLSRQSGNPNGEPALGERNTIFAAHVLGHNFDARHLAADDECIGGACGRTIMWSTYDASHHIPFFSNGLHAGRDNRTNIRNFMIQQGFF